MRKEGKCYNCGREGYLVRDKNCPAKAERKKCAKCERRGHFALCCQGKRDSHKTGGKTGQPRPYHNVIKRNLIVRT